MIEPNGNWWLAVENAVVTGKPVFATIPELDEACEHVVALARDASVMIANGSYSTAAFLAITALEETAKIHVSIFRRGNNVLPRRNDPLHQHKAKHILALGPTVSMGNRLPKLIGSDRMTELISICHVGGLVRIRESALYVERSEKELLTPKKAISPTLASELLLLALEVFDDALVGYSNQSFVLSREMDRIFDQVSLHYRQLTACRGTKAS